MTIGLCRHGIDTAMRHAAHGSPPGCCPNDCALLGSPSASTGAPLDLVTEVLAEIHGDPVRLFDGEHDARRAAFRALLGDRRMRVLPDPDRLFRVEGLFELVLETADARNHEDSGRLHSQVAGGRFV